jgi:hypothetical protein
MNVHDIFFLITYLSNIASSGTENIRLCQVYFSQSEFLQIFISLILGTHSVNQIVMKEICEKVSNGKFERNGSNEKKVCLIFNTLPKFIFYLLIFFYETRVQKKK